MLIQPKDKHTRCRDIRYSRFEIQDYVLSKILTTQNKKLLFQMRTKSYPILENIPYVKNKICYCCKSYTDSLDHPLWCSIMTRCNPLVDRNTMLNIDDIYSTNVQTQSQIVIIFEQAIRRRKIFLEHIKVNIND